MATTNKKFFGGFFLLLLLLAIWYFFIKPEDYIFTFKGHTSPGTLKKVMDFCEIQWSEKDGSHIVSRGAFDSDFREQLITSGDTVVKLDWEFKSVNDSLTRIRVGATHLDKSFISRLTAPFIESELEYFALRHIKNYKKALEDHLNYFKVRVKGERFIPEKRYACIEAEGSLEEKAPKMMRENGFLTSWLAQNGIKTTGYPSLEVTHWSLNKNRIKFNFCFPIVPSDSFPSNTTVFVRQVRKQKALMAEFYGNYKISDRAWFALYEYALLNNLKVNYTPFEIFYSNPHMGGNELKWKAEVFLPLQQ